MKVRFNGGIKDVPLNEVTAKNYIVPQGEEKHWHVIQEKKEFDRNTGKQLSRPVLQKYDTKSYPATERYLRQAGYTITVLHDPVEWMRKDAEKLAALRQIQAEQAKRKAAEQAARYREALKAELRKELMAEVKAELKASKGKSNK